MCNRHRLAAHTFGDPLAVEKRRAATLEQQAAEAQARADLRLAAAATKDERACVDCGASFYTVERYRRRCTPCLAKRTAAPPFDCATCGTRVTPGVAGDHHLRRVYCSPRCKQRGRAHNTEARRAAKDRRRARKRDAYVADVCRSEIFARDGWTCRLCGEPIAADAQVPHPHAPTIDHIVPLAAGGTHEPDNCQAAHFVCNSRKGARIVEALA